MLKQLTLNEYEKLLNVHDWYYMMSDDQYVYTRGAHKQSELKAMATTPEMKEMFEHYQNKHKIN
jgi:hypothetical protein